MNLLFWGKQKSGKHALWLFVWWGEMLNFDLHFICTTVTTFFAEIHWYIPCAKIPEIFVKARACVYIFLLILGKTNESLHPLDRVRERRKMKWKLSYINGQNCHLQSLLELPLQIEHLGDSSFCVYLNEANISMRKKQHIQWNHI